MQVWAYFTTESAFDTPIGSIDSSKSPKEPPDREAPPQQGPQPARKTNKKEEKENKKRGPRDPTPPGAPRDQISRRKAMTNIHSKTDYLRKLCPILQLRCHAKTTKPVNGHCHCVTISASTCSATTPPLPATLRVSTKSPERRNTARAFSLCREHEMRWAMRKAIEDDDSLPSVEADCESQSTTPRSPLLHPPPCASKINGQNLNPAAAH